MPPTPPTPTPSRQPLRNLRRLCSSFPRPSPPPRTSGRNATRARWTPLPRCIPAMTSRPGLPCGSSPWMPTPATPSAPPASPSTTPRRSAAAAPRPPRWRASRMPRCAHCCASRPSARSNWRKSIRPPWSAPATGSRRSCCPTPRRRRQPPRGPAWSPNAPRPTSTPRPNSMSDVPRPSRAHPRRGRPAGPPRLRRTGAGNRGEGPPRRRPFGRRHPDGVTMLLMPRDRISRAHTLRQDR